MEGLAFVATGLLIFALSCFYALAVLAALSDLASLTIPNWISGALAGMFVAILPFGLLSFAGIAWHFAGAIAVLASMVFLFALGWIGGGDAKLIPALALWMGPEALAPFLVMTALMGGLLAAVLLGLRALPIPLPLLKQAWIARLLTPTAGIPYGVAITAGALAAFPGSALGRVFFQQI